MIRGYLSNIAAFKAPKVGPTTTRTTGGRTGGPLYNPIISEPGVDPNQPTDQGGIGGAAPPATPSAPANQIVDPNTLAHDSIYDAEVARLHANRANAEAAVPGQLTQGAQSYGYNYNEGTGAIGEDASNPYSRRQLLVESYANARRGNTNSLAARGQLYSGSLQNAQDTSQRTYNSSQDSLKRAYQTFVQGVLSGRTKAQDDESAGMIAAESNNLSRAIANKPDAPASDGMQFSPSDWAAIFAALNPQAAGAPVVTGSKRQKTTGR